VGLKVDDEGDDEDLRGLKSNLQYFQCVCQVDLCVNVVDLHIMREHPNYYELRKIVTVC
jgi:hypothetical protein